MKAFRADLKRVARGIVMGAPFAIAFGAAAAFITDTGSITSWPLHIAQEPRVVQGAPGTPTRAPLARPSVSSTAPVVARQESPLVVVVQPPVAAPVQRDVPVVEVVPTTTTTRRPVPPPPPVTTPPRPTSSAPTTTPPTSTPTSPTSEASSGKEEVPEEPVVDTSTALG